MQTKDFEPSSRALRLDRHEEIINMSQQFSLKVFSQNQNNKNYPLQPNSRHSLIIYAYFKNFG